MELLERLLPAPPARFSAALGDARELAGPDPVFRPIVDQDLADGQHRNPDPTDRPQFFTTACFHTPTAWPARPSRLASPA